MVSSLVGEMGSVPYYSRVVKLLGVFEMVGADHDMAEHGVPPVTHTGKIWA